MLELSGRACALDMHIYAFFLYALLCAFLCAAAIVAAASGLLEHIGLRLHCTCARPHPSQVLGYLLLSLRSGFPFVAAASDDQEEEQDDDEEEENGEEIMDAGLQRELEQERSAAASAAEEAMAMILRVQKEKGALEIELRQDRRTAEERRAFYEEEVEQLREMLLIREQEARDLQTEVEGYRRMLGLPAEDDNEENKPSSSKSVVPSILADHVKGENEDRLAAMKLGQNRIVGSRLDTDLCGEDDGAPLSARSLDLPLPARRFDREGSESDANIYDVHVVDDTGFSAEVKTGNGNFLDATTPTEKLQNRVAVDDIPGECLYSAQDKIKLVLDPVMQELPVDQKEIRARPKRVRRTPARIAGNDWV